MASIDQPKQAEATGSARAAALRPRQLIGKERESSEVKESVVASPVTTLTGPGGVGKTALATSVAATSSADFADGLIVVWLGSLRSAELVVSRWRHKPDRIERLRNVGVHGRYRDRN
jgi:MoxR-like ATPase